MTGNGASRARIADRSGAVIVHLVMNDLLYPMGIAYMTRQLIRFHTTTGLVSN